MRDFILCYPYVTVQLKEDLQKLIASSLQSLQHQGDLAETGLPEIKIERTRDKAHGDFSSNIAMVLAKPLQTAPRQLAELIVRHLPDSGLIRQTEIAGPGFINFFLQQDAQHAVISEILQQAETFGSSEFGRGSRILIEFVSANPTGPLHVGHGRGAAYGATVANLLENIGYRVDREYYVNDAGRQMDILALSVYLRYLQCCDIEIGLPDACYQGDYIKTIAAELFEQQGKQLVVQLEEPVDAENDDEKLDMLIDQIKAQLADRYPVVHAIGLNTILDEIKSDLDDFGVSFDRWYSERTLHDEDRISAAIEQLENNGHIYEKDGAKWFRSSSLGDEKDRVVVRENGNLTYFAADIAYHVEKFSRGYDRIIDIWGADHHGYIARVRAALQASGLNPDDMDVLLVQFVSLYRGSEKMQMSTRSGQFVTLSALRDEVGRDATRFFYVMRKSEQHLDFDLELATSSSKDNPVYYIQYAHARICRLFDKVKQDDMSCDMETMLSHIQQLDSEKESALIAKLGEYKELVHTAAVQHEPHLLVYYLKDLANQFHTFYDTHRIMDQAESTKLARLALCAAVKIVIANGLQLLGVSAPESM